MLKTIIVEDSRLARNEIKTLLTEYELFQIVAEASNVEEALVVINKHCPDVIFLDINLPDGTGFEVLTSLDFVPQTIFTTAYDEFAVKAFEHNALDYLLKPIKKSDLARAVERLDTNRKIPNEQSSTLSMQSKIFVKENDNCWLIEIQKIRYFESCGNHTRIYFEQHKPFIYKSLNKIDLRLSKENFFRVSRKYIVNLDFVNNLKTAENQGLIICMNDGKEILVSRRNASQLKQWLSF